MAVFVRHNEFLFRKMHEQGYGELLLTSILKDVPILIIIFMPSFLMDAL